jgi:hypothetical protein
MSSAASATPPPTKDKDYSFWLEEEDDENKNIDAQVDKSIQLQQEILESMIKHDIDEDMMYLTLYELVVYFEHRLKTEYDYTSEDIIHLQKSATDIAEEYIKYEDEQDLEDEKAKWKRTQIVKKKNSKQHIGTINIDSEVMDVSATAATFLSERQQHQE